MANTSLLKTLIEPYVRSWLSRTFSIEFELAEIPIRLSTGGLHRFDAVSKDRTIIAGIKSSGLRNYKSKLPIGVGVIKSTFTELYFLSLVKADKKLLILTDEKYYKHFLRVSDGKVAKGIEIIYCSLTNEILAKTASVHKSCSNEIGKKILPT